MSSSKRNVNQAILAPEGDTVVKRRRHQDEEIATPVELANDAEINTEGKLLEQVEQETVYFLRIICMYIDLGTEVLFKVFLHLSPNTDVVTFLKSRDSTEKLKQLKKSNILSGKEYRLVIRDPPKPDEFDISLLITLMINLLPNDVLPAPKWGWYRPPSETDLSLSADILRLRKIRNDIVAHREKPRIPEWKFDKAWHQTTEIILRLTRKITPGHEDETVMKERIDQYKDRILDPSETKRFKIIIDEWNEAFHERVEKLLKTLSEFDLYFINESGRYERYIKLLFEGGHTVLLGVLERELMKRNIDVEGMLGQNMNLLQREIDPVYRKILFSTEQCEDIHDASKWDILLLATVLLTVFGEDLNPNEITEIKRIHKAMTDHAEAALTALDSNRFLPLWTDLVSSIKCLSMTIHADLKQKCDGLIEVCSHRVNVDFSQLQRNCSKLKSITDVFKEQVKELRELLTQMRELEIPFRQPQTLGVKFITHGSSKEKVEMADKIVFTVWQEALNRAEDSTELKDVRREVDKILNEIRRIPSVTDLKVTHHCIILTIQCNSPIGVLELMDYLENESFQQSVGSLAKELENNFDEAFIVKGNFTLDSLHDVKSKIISDRGIEGNRNEVNCPISFSSATGMKAVWSLLKSKEIEDSMKKISKTLSQKLGEEITLRTSVKGFYHLFDETESDTSSSDSMSQSTAQEDMTREITKYTTNGSVSQHHNNSGENNSGMFTDSWSTDSLCGYTQADDIEHLQYKEVENTYLDATTKVDNLTFSILAKTEKDSDQIQIERRTGFQEHGHDDHGKFGTLNTGDVSYVHTQTQISIGDSIRPLDKSSFGTVGPFIRIKDTGELCFLTVRHIFGRLVTRDRDVVGTKVVHCLNNHSKSFRQNNDRICGEVIAAEYSEYLDAALVKISKDHIPNRYSFTIVPEEQCHKAGFSVPKYANIHSVIDLEKASTEEIRKMQLIKFGSATGLTLGTFHFTDEKVNTENVTILSEDPKLWIMEAVPCQNYVHVGGIDNDIFARKEDDGAAVYLLDKDSQLHCVGMLCRQMSQQEGYLVGQLEVILERLGEQIGMTLEIDKYEKLDDTVDPYDKELFSHALQDGFECDRQIRVNIIGFFAQGKTTLTRRLLNEPFDDIACTDGIEVYVRKCKMLGNNWKTCDRRDIYEDCSRRIVDVVNLEQRNAPDFNEEPSFDEADRGREIDVTRTNVVGSFTASSNVSVPMGDTLVKRNAAFITNDPEVELRRLFAMHLRDTERETESDGLLANIWDFGGQFIYYATHQIFHSTDAIYLLVFDLTKDLDTMIIDCDFPDRQEKMKNSLMFWVNSIHAFVGADDTSESLRPKIILVGTHKDKFHGDVNAKFKDVFDLFSGTKLRKHIHDTPFAVASLEMEDEGVDDLKSSIYEIGVNNARQRHIPAKWIPLEISMLEMRDKKQILKFDDVVLMDAQNSHPITDQSQIKMFLNYHHEKGTIVFFNEDVLNKYVILNPQFLVNAFKCIITAKWFCRWNQNVQDNFKTLTREAVLEMNLLTEVWSQDRENNFIQFKDVLLLFLERHRILAEIRRMDETTGDIKRLGKYMIPSMLRRDLDQNVVGDFLQDRQYTLVILGLELQGLESVTVFEKVTAALLGKWPPIEYNSQVLVFQNAGLYRLDLQHAGQIRKTDDNIELMVINLCPPDQADSVVCDRFRRYVEMVVSYEYRRNHLHKQEKPYKHYFKCNDPEHRGVGSHNYHYLDDIRNQLKVCCPDNRSRPIPVQNAIKLWFQGENITDMETNAIRTATENDDLIARVAQEYGENWKLFGIAIGLSNEELNPIGDQGKEVSVLIFAMFKIWRKKYPKNINYKNQRERCGGSGVHVDWDKIRNCLDVSLRHDIIKYM